MNPLLGLVGALLLIPPAPPPAPVLGAPAPVAQPGPASRDGPAKAVRPVPGDVAHGFDPPEELWDSGHRGVDLTARPGETVLSALPGTVSFAGEVAGRGVVTVDHGSGRRTSYEPVLAWVEAGEEVGPGEVIGVVEAIPGHCFPGTCLHWGLREGDDYRDPLSLLGPRRIRLLPLLG